MDWAKPGCGRADDTSVNEYPLTLPGTAPLQRHRNVPICNIYGPTASYILVFAERQVLAEAVEKVGAIRF